MSEQPVEIKASENWEENADHALAVTLAASYTPGCPEEKKLLRKLDFRIIVRGLEIFHYPQEVRLTCLSG